jgi:hypothetical protein
MEVLNDIWITLDPAEVVRALPEGTPEPPSQALARTMEAFHQKRRAEAAFEIIEPTGSPLLPETIRAMGAESGVAAVAATLGAGVEELASLDWGQACLKAGLAQLEAFVCYRIMKRVGTRKLNLGPPLVPGGAAAPGLKLQGVLDLLGPNPLGIRVEDGMLKPTWSLAYLYPVGLAPAKASSCASCSKDCALRR